MTRVTKSVSKRNLFPSYAVAVLSACGVLVTGCGDDDKPGPEDAGTRATGGRATGGAVGNTGGTATGGTSTAGGQAATGGTTSMSTTSTGGALASGGSATTATGGANVGGSTADGSAAGGMGTTGGTTSTSSGTAAVGGVMAVGGTSATSGGESSVGGATSVGGTTATGGTFATGGGSGIGGDGPDATVGPLRSVDIDLTGMTSGINRLMVFRVVNSDDELVSVAVLDPLPAATYSFTLPSAVPEGLHRLEFFADLSGDRVYTPMSTDEAWSRPIPQSPSPTVNFNHNTNYTDLSTSPTVPIGADFSFHATGMIPHVGDMFELRVIVADTGQVVGTYHLHSIPAATFDIVIPGIIANSVPYRVDFWTDVNGNGEYNSPPIDHSWRMTGSGTGTGLALSFTHNTDFTDVAF